MSKVEVLRQIENFSREDLDEVAERIDQLRFADEDALPPGHGAILAERIAEYEKDRDPGQPVEQVVERIRASLKR